MIPLMDLEGAGKDEIREMLSLEETRFARGSWELAACRRSALQHGSLLFPPALLLLLMIMKDNEWDRKIRSKEDGRVGCQQAWHATTVDRCTLGSRDGQPGRGLPCRSGLTYPRVAGGSDAPASLGRQSGSDSGLDGWGGARLDSRLDIRNCLFREGRTRR